MEDDDYTVTVDISKPRVCNKSSKDLLKPISVKRVLVRTMDKRPRKLSDSVLQKYLIRGNKPIALGNLKKDELLMPYKAYLKIKQNERHKQKLAIGICDKYKIISFDLKNRLYIENPPDDVLALTDVDKSFFNYISGRPVSDRGPLFKSLQVAVADLFRIKQEISSRHDAILNIEVNSKQELKTYNLSSKRCKEQAICFDSFISEDYRKSMSFLEKWDKLKLDLHMKQAELRNTAAEEFTIKSKLMGLDYLYSIQQKYGRFLYYLSPPSWRANNRDFAQSVEIEAKGFDLGNSSDEDTFKVVFDKMRKECLQKLVKPALYFTHPSDLLNIYDGIEKQQLHHFSYVTHLAPHKKMIKEEIKYLKDIIKQESAFVESTIHGFEKLMAFSNDRCFELKTKFYAILNGLFYESVGAPEVLKLFVHLEFCYERIYGEKAVNMDIVAMAKALETCYMDYSKRLDEIHSNTVKQAIAQGLASERRKMRKARFAARELRQFARLEHDLLNAHATVADKHQPFLPPIKGGAVPRKCIKREHSKPNIKVKEEKPLDESELEYLKLFTDWTEGEDPNIYLHRLDNEH